MTKVSLGRLLQSLLQAAGAGQLAGIARGIETFNDRKVRFGQAHHGAQDRKSVV